MKIYDNLDANIKDILEIINSVSKLDAGIKLKLNNYYMELSKKIMSITDLNILNKYFDNISYNRDMILKNEISFNKNINYIEFLYYI